MPDTTATLRAQLLSADRAGPGRGYAPALRERVARHVLAQRELGTPITTLAQELGVPASTLLRWCRVFEESALSAFRPVRICEDDPPTFTLHGPAGTRLEGLDLDTLIAVWRRLAS